MAPIVQTVKSGIQSALTRVGAHSTERSIFALNRGIDYLEVGRWMRARGFEVPRRVDDRTELYDLVAAEFGDQPVNYMEFGVFDGASMRYWSRILRHPDSTLHGFDSFEGLPETWNALNLRGQFTTEGGVPVIDDPRVEFFKGWFHDTLPLYEWPDDRRPLVANLDADLYSSTRYVLDQLAPRLAVGSFLVFDEFMDRDHELKAFDEFLDASRMRFDVRGATKNMVHVLFQRIG